MNYYIPFDWDFFISFLQLPPTGFGGFSKGFTLEEIRHFTIKDINRILKYIESFHKKKHTKGKQVNPNDLQALMKKMQEDYKSSEDFNKVWNSDGTRKFSNSGS